MADDDADDTGTDTDPADEGTGGAPDNHPEPATSRREDPPTPDAKPDPEPDDTDDDDGYTPPSETEWKRAQAALAKANEEAKRHRLAAKKLRDDADAERRKNENEHEKALREARETAAGEVESRYKPIVVRGAARAALAESGAILTGADGKPSPTRLDRMLKLIDLDELEVGDDGEVTGLDSQVAQIKADYPEFFERPRPPARPKADAADRKPEPAKPKSSAERLAASLGGKG